MKRNNIVFQEVIRLIKESIKEGEVHEFTRLKSRRIFGVLTSLDAEESLAASTITQVAKVNVTVLASISPLKRILGDHWFYSARDLRACKGATQALPMAMAWAIRHLTTHSRLELCYDKISGELEVKALVHEVRLDVHGRYPDVLIEADPLIGRIFCHDGMPYRVQLVEKRCFPEPTRKRNACVAKLATVYACVALLGVPSIRDFPAKVIVDEVEYVPSPLEYLLLNDPSLLESAKGVNKEVRWFLKQFAKAYNVLDGAVWFDDFKYREAAVSLPSYYGLESILSFFDLLEIKTPSFDAWIALTRVGSRDEKTQRAADALCATAHETILQQAALYGLGVVEVGNKRSRVG